MSDLIGEIDAQSRRGNLATFAVVGSPARSVGPMKARLAERKPDELEHRDNIPSDA